MATDFLFEVNQWADLHWKQVIGTERNFRFVPGEPVIDIVVWTGRPTTGENDSRGENSKVNAAKMLTEIFTLAQLPV